jgi:hypothetical protein
MSGAISPLPQHSFMAWCSYKAQELYYYYYYYYYHHHHHHHHHTNLARVSGHGVIGQVHQNTRNSEFACFNLEEIIQEELDK